MSCPIEVWDFCAHENKIANRFQDCFYSFSNTETIMLESIFCATCYIRDVVLFRQRLLKENEEILKWFPYGGNRLHAEQ